MDTVNQTTLWNKNNNTDHKGILGFIALFEKHYGEALKLEDAHIRAERLMRLVKIVYNL